MPTLKSNWRQPHIYPTVVCVSEVQNMLTSSENQTWPAYAPTDRHDASGACAGWISSCAAMLKHWPYTFCHSGTGHTEYEKSFPLFSCFPELLPPEMLNLLFLSIPRNWALPRPRTKQNRAPIKPLESTCPLVVQLEPPYWGYYTQPHPVFYFLFR